MSLFVMVYVSRDKSRHIYIQNYIRSKLQIYTHLQNNLFA